MIEIIQGVVGGGKTYLAVRKALARVAAGGVVYSNIDFCRAGFRRYILSRYGLRMHSDQLRPLPETEGVKDWWSLVEWGTMECPVLVILDEAQLFWNARDFAKTAKQQGDMLSFLTQSRKAGLDIIFISQDDGNIDKQFRVLAEIVTTCRNMGKNPVPVFGFKLAGWFIYESREAVNGGLLSREWHRRDLGIFAAYKTAAFLDTLMQSMSADRSQRIARRQLQSGIGPLYRLGLKMRLLKGLDAKIGRLLCYRSITRTRRNRHRRNNEGNNHHHPDPRGNNIRGSQDARNAPAQ